MKHVRFSSMTKFGMNIALAFSFLCMSTPSALSEPLISSHHYDGEIVQEKRVRNVEPGTLDYESRYVMTKDKQGTYRTTYHSEKKEWFCCLSWFSSSQEKREMKGPEVKN